MSNQINYQWYYITHRKNEYGRSLYTLTTARKRYEFATFEEAKKALDKHKKAKVWALFYKFENGRSGVVSPNGLPNCDDYKKWDWKNEQNS